jgi:hypothetical protein
MENLILGNKMDPSKTMQTFYFSAREAIRQKISSFWRSILARVLTSVMTKVGSQVITCHQLGCPSRQLIL